jgi:hypothetical protein
MSVPGAITIRDLTSFETDEERGRLLELWDGAVQAMVDVRANLRERKLRELTIAELERRGYTVIPPEAAP